MKIFQILEKCLHKNMCIYEYRLVKFVKAG